MGREMGKIGQGEFDIADLDCEQPDLLMRQLEKIIEKAEVVHRLEGRGMDRVAAKIPEKIGVFFENDRIDASAGKEKPEHHPGGSAADDAAAAGECLRSLVHSPPIEAQYAGSSLHHLAREGLRSPSG